MGGKHVSCPTVCLLLGPLGFALGGSEGEESSRGLQAAGLGPASPQVCTCGPWRHRGAGTLGQ